MLTPSVTREKQHPQSLRSRRKRKSGSTNRGYWTLKWDLSRGSFTPLVFGTNGGMGSDCNCFLKRLASREAVTKKNWEPYHFTITWVRTLLSFEILRTFPQNSTSQDFIDNCRLNASQACVR